MTNATPANASITDSDPFSSTPENLNFDSVLQEMKQWRNTKPLRQTAIPDALWHKIIVLGEHHGSAKIRALFGVSGKQYIKKKTQFFPKPSQNTTSQKDVENVQFCKIKNPTSASTSTTKSEPAYKPCEVPHANHVTVVEFCRSDGQIMKIHTTTHNLNTIIHTFFEGHTHAAHTASS